VDGTQQLHFLISIAHKLYMVFIWYEVTRLGVKNLRSHLGGMQVHFSASQGHSMLFEKQKRGLIRIWELEYHYVN
jgi:hypothetical protein